MESTNLLNDTQKLERIIKSNQNVYKLLNKACCEIRPEDVKFLFDNFPDMDVNKYISFGYTPLTQII